MLRYLYICFGFLASSTVIASIEKTKATIRSVDVESRTIEIQRFADDEQKSTLETVTVGMGDASIYRAGDQIEGQITQSDGKLLMERIWPHDPDIDNWMASVNRDLRRDTATRQTRRYRKEGDYSMNFAMFNQTGEAIQFDDFKGKWVILNFIFTRCQVAEMCPAQTNKMVKLQNAAIEAGIEELKLLSVTFDPKYDTPGILHSYAEDWGANFDYFSFLTGEYQTMLDVLKQYGVIAYESERIIDHTVVTLLFNKAGRIVLRKNSSRWSEKDFIKRIIQ